MKNAVLKYSPLRFTRFLIETSVLAAVTSAVVSTSLHAFRMGL